MAGKADQNAIVVWDAGSGHQMAQLGVPDTQVRSARFSPDGKSIVGVGVDSSVRVWDLVKASEILNLKGAAFTSGAFDMSPDGHRIVTAQNKKILVWDTSPGQTLQSVEDETDVVFLAYTQDGKTLVGMGFNGQIRVRDVDTLKLRGSHETGHKGPMPLTAASSDGKRVVRWVFSSDAKVFDTESGALVATLQMPRDTLQNLAFSPDGQRVVAGTASGFVRLWNAADGQGIGSFQAHGSGCHAAFSPDGKRLVTGGLDKSVKVWDLTRADEQVASTGADARKGQKSDLVKGHGSTVDCVAFSPDGTKLVSGAKDFTVKIWDAKTGRPLRTFEAQMAEIRSVAISPDGKQVAAVADLRPGSTDRVLRIWNAANGREVFSVNGQEFGDVAFSPDGKRVAAIGPGGVLGMLDTAKGRPMGNLKADNTMLLTFGFSPDGKQVSTVGPTGVKVWDTAKGKLIQGYEIPPGERAYYARAVFLSRDGKRLLRGVRDRLQVVDVETGKAIRDDIKPFHLPAAVIGFSPDGKRLVCSSVTGRVLKVVDVETGQEVSTFQGQKTFISAVAFSPDGSQVFSGDSSGGLKLWEAATGKEIFGADGAGMMANVQVRGGTMRIRLGDAPGGAGPMPGQGAPADPNLPFIGQGPMPGQQQVGGPVVPDNAGNVPPRRPPMRTRGATRGGPAAPGAGPASLPTNRTLLAGAESDEPSTWLYTTEEPTADWYAPSFEPQGWKEGKPGFCSEGHRSVKKNTPWHSPSIWMRTTVDLPRLTGKESFVLRVAHDDGLTVYLNGTKIYQRDDVGPPGDIVLDDTQTALFHAGKNILAAKGVDTGGECAVDVALRVEPKK